MFRIVLRTEKQIIKLNYSFSFEMGENVSVFAISFESKKNY